MPGRVCSLPEYSFDRKLYHKIAEDSQSSKKVYRGNIYQEEWVKYENYNFDAEAKSKNSNIFLIFRAGIPDEDKLIQCLAAQSSEVIEVIPAEGDLKLREDGRYSIDPLSNEAYIRLVEDLNKKRKLPNKILFLWQPSSKENKYTIYNALLFLSKTISRFSAANKIEIYTVVEGGYRISGDEELNTDTILAYGPSRVISQEYQDINCHILDVRIGTVSNNSKSITKLMESTDLPIVTALRGSIVWHRVFAPKAIEQSTSKEAVGFRNRGVYAITGGFGGLGSEVAKFLAGEFKAQLILCSRKDRSNHLLLKDIESLGGSAISLEVNMQDEEAGYIILDAALTNFGALDGILHTAGIPGETMIQRQDESISKKVIETKISAVPGMIEIVKNQKSDFLAFFSSVTGLLGGFGQVDYCSANAMLDAISENCQQAGMNNIYSIRWDTWKEVGMAVTAEGGAGDSAEVSLMQTLVLSDGSRNIYRSKISYEDCWALKEHIVMEVPTLPGTAYLELAGAAYTAKTGKQGKKFSDVYFLSPLCVRPGENLDLYTILEKENNQLTFEIGSYSQSKKDGIYMLKE